MSELPSNWEEARLGDIATSRMGKTILSKELVTEGLPVFSASIGTEPWGFTSDASISYPRGTIIISARGTIGDIKLPDYDRFVSTQTTIATTPSVGIDPSFLRHTLRCVDWPSFTATTAIPMLTIAKLNDVAVKVPPTNEQRRIVAKIESLTGKSRRARDHLDHIPRLVEKYKQAVLDMVFADLSSRAPLSEQVEPERGIPYGIVQTGDPFEGGVPTIRCGDIKGFRVARDGLKLVNPEIESGFRRTRLRGSEVLIAIRGSVGETCVVPSELIDCNISREVAMIPLRQGIVPDFIMYFLATTEAKRFILGNVKGVAQQGINLRDLKELPAPTGDTDTQREVVMRILRAFDWINRLASEATSARRLIDRLDQSVLAKAFRGELVPQDPADEPASVLLERIRAERGATPKTRRGRKPKGAA